MLAMVRNLSSSAVDFSPPMVLWVTDSRLISPTLSRLVFFQGLSCDAAASEGISFSVLHLSIQASARCLLSSSGSPVGSGPSLAPPSFAN